MHACKKLSAIEDQVGPSKEMPSLQGCTHRFKDPLPIRQHYEQPPAESFVKSKPTIKIGYILCRDLFTHNQEMSYISINPKHDKMEFLISQICDINGISERQLTLELFSQSGYPLNVNVYTMKCELDIILNNKMILLLYIVTVERWKIQDGDTFFAFIRRKEQPTFIFDELKENDTIDPTNGIYRYINCSCT